MSSLKNKTAAGNLRNPAISTVEGFIKEDVGIKGMATLPMNYITKDKCRRILAGGGCYSKPRLACDIPSLQYVIPKDVPKALAALASCLHTVQGSGLGADDEFSFKHSIAKSTVRVMSGLLMYNRNRVPLREIRIVGIQGAQTGETGLIHADGGVKFGIK